MRRLRITIQDENTDTSISGTSTVEDVNRLYSEHKINGITQMLIQLNSELNTILKEDMKIELPSEIETLPPGAKW